MMLTSRVRSSALADLMSPFLFNPHGFELWLRLEDLGKWVRWLADGGDKGWGGHHRAICDKKKGTEAHSLLLPSKEMLISFPFVVIYFEAFRRYGWGWLELALTALPLLPSLVTAMGVTACKLAGRRTPASQGGRHKHTHIMVAAVSFVALQVAEVVALALLLPGLPASHWVAIVAARYTCWRFLANSVAYLFQLRSPTKVADAPQRSLTEFMARELLDGCALMVAGLALLADALLGLALNLAVLALCLVPFISSAHGNRMRDMPPAQPAAAPRETRSPTARSPGAALFPPVDV